jgi:hypothetical protein
VICEFPEWFTSQNDVISFDEDVSLAIQAFVNQTSLEPSSVSNAVAEVTQVAQSNVDSSLNDFVTQAAAQAQTI